MPKIPLNSDPPASGNIVNHIMHTVSPIVRAPHEVTEGDFQPRPQTKTWTQNTLTLSVVDATPAADPDQDSAVGPDPDAPAIQVTRTAAYHPLATTLGIA